MLGSPDRVRGRSDDHDEPGTHTGIYLAHQLADVEDDDDFDEVFDGSDDDNNDDVDSDAAAAFRALALTEPDPDHLDGPSPEPDAYYGPRSFNQLCFVSVGATVGFAALLRAVLDPEFVRALARRGFDRMIVQHGPLPGPDDPFRDSAAVAYPALSAAALRAAPRLRIEGFGLRAAGLADVWRAVRGDVPGFRKGLAITHAGTGTILEAMRMSVPLIVVPNPALADNHQETLAVTLAQLGYVVHGQLQNMDAALDEADALVQRMVDGKPINNRPVNLAPGSFSDELDRECGFMLD